ncbi:MAG: ABC transporter substrate-binding protein [Dehalococcoidia bacterium]|nr:MAG: ABC transporter substrate-binding protein [Dehalococcoidia bacterium]
MRLVIILDVMSHSLVLLTSSLLALLVACSPIVPSGAAVGTPGAGPPCPAQPLNVIAVENQYGSLALQLGGACVRVVNVISSADADPHEYQVDAVTARAYQSAHVILQNGLGYDEFSEKLVSTLSTRPVVVTFGEVVGLKEGDNPHIWYHPDYVARITAAITAAFKRARPELASYFDQQATVLDQSMADYRSLVAEIRQKYRGTPIGLTETLFVYMAEATELQILTPRRLLDALSEEGQPSVTDVAAVQTQIQQRQIRVLVYNAQTESNLTKQWQEMATRAGIPVVPVTETMVPIDDTFQGWQTRQLRALLAALGG